MIGASLSKTRGENYCCPVLKTGSGKKKKKSEILHITQRKREGSPHREEGGALYNGKCEMEIEKNAKPMSLLIRAAEKEKKTRRRRQRIRRQKGRRKLRRPDDPQTMRGG